MPVASGRIRRERHDSEIRLAGNLANLLTQKRLRRHPADTLHRAAIRCLDDPRFAHRLPSAGGVDDERNRSARPEHPDGIFIDFAVEEDPALEEFSIVSRETAYERSREHLRKSGDDPAAIRLHAIGECEREIELAAQILRHLKRALPRGFIRICGHPMLQMRAPLHRSVRVQSERAHAVMGDTIGFIDAVAGSAKNQRFRGVQRIPESVKQIAELFIVVNRCEDQDDFRRHFPQGFAKLAARPIAVSINGTGGFAPHLEYSAARRLRRRSVR